MILIKNLTKKYGTKQVLNDINLEFEKGKVYGIVGENGAGKTTLFKCIAGLEYFDGSIKSEYVDLKNHLGLLFSDPFFFSRITGKEYLQLLANTRQIPLKTLKDKNLFGLPLHQYASTYSTGMKKKLALTGVLLQNNDYFILDEPFNGVDIQSNLIITELIHKLKAMGKTVILSSHIFSTLAETCDQIHLLKQGKIERTVLKSKFEALETEMKAFTIGNRIDAFGLE